MTIGQPRIKLSNLRPNPYAWPVNSASTTDEELMLSYGNGDANAFDELYTRHKGPLYRYLLRQCRHQNTVDELFQEVWMKLIKARRQYQVTATFKTWLYHIARNCYIDFVRKQNVRLVDTDNTSAEIIPDIMTPQPDQHVFNQQQAKQLLSLVETLPTDLRDIFLLRQEAGMTINEIADVTGISAEAARSRWRTAVKQLSVGLQSAEESGLLCDRYVK